MTCSRALDRLLAYHVGRPLPHGATLPLERRPAADRLLVAFVALGGETAPWGVIWGHPGQTPTVSCTHDPRDRRAVAAMLLPFAGALLAHLPHPASFVHDDERSLSAQAIERQLWMPGRSHVDMLHLLDYRLSPSRSRGEETGEPTAEEVTLAALARACGWLFRESCRDGQQRVIDATERLREAYTFPSDDAHASHLGFLLAWLTTPGARAGRLEAAVAAEERAVGLHLHPTVEAREVEPRLDELHGQRAPSAARREELEAAVRQVVEQALRERWALLEQAAHALEADQRPSLPRSDAIDALASSSFGFFWEDECKRLRGEDSFDTHAETDGHVIAAFRLLMQERGQDAIVQRRLHGDRRWLDEAVAAGEALRGQVVSVTRLGKRGRRTLWVLETEGTAPLRLREGAKVCPAGVPAMKAVIRSVQAQGSGRRVEVEVSGQYDAGLAVGFPAADDARGLVGREVSLVPPPMESILVRRSIRLARREGPGDWIASSAAGPSGGSARHLSEDVLAVVEGLR